MNESGVIGYRIWLADPGRRWIGTPEEWSLNAVGNGSEWSSVMNAECKAPVPSRCVLETVPNVACKCGIYSTYNIMGALDEALVDTAPYVLGAVVNYTTDTGADLLLHDNWIRSPQAEIVALAEIGPAFGTTPRRLTLGFSTADIEGSFGHKIAQQLGGIPVVPIDGLKEFAAEFGHHVDPKEVAAAAGVSKSYVEDMKRGETKFIPQKALTVDASGRMFLKSNFSVQNTRRSQTRGRQVVHPFRVERKKDGAIVLSASKIYGDKPDLIPVLVREVDGRAEHAAGNPDFGTPVAEFLCAGRSIAANDEGIAVFPVKEQRHLLDLIPRNQLRRVSLDFHVHQDRRCALPRTWTPVSDPSAPFMEIERSDSGWRLDLPPGTPDPSPQIDSRPGIDGTNIHECPVTEITRDGVVLNQNPAGARWPLLGPGAASASKPSDYSHGFRLGLSR